MGRRHLRSYRVLRDFEPGRVELAAVIDPEPKRAAFVAGEAEELLGKRPQDFRSMEDAVAGCPDLALVDIVAAPAAHHTIAETAFAAGVHVLTEKPMTPTVAACRAMQTAAEKHGCILSVAENFRRDPICRLTKALIEAGAIGDIRTVIEHSVSAKGNAGVSDAWRFTRKHGGPILEQAVHYADLQYYLAGPVERVSGRVRIHEAERVFKGAKVKSFHDHTAAQYPDVQAVDAPDALFGNLEFSNGALGQWLYDESVRGRGFRRFVIYGSEGMVEIPSQRSGRPVTLLREGHKEPLSGEEMLSLVPDFALDDRTEKYFGGRRIAQYEQEEWYGARESDLKLLAMEVSELLDAIEGGAPVEVGPEEGLAAVALVLAFHESSEAHRCVSMEEVLDGSLSRYQDAANRELGLS